MENSNNTYSEILRMIAGMKTERYAIYNSETASLDEYTKNMYLRMLCTIIQYNNAPSNMQLLYLQRLHHGIKTQVSLEDYMRQALDIADVDAREFIENMRKKRVKYYFVLESILLIVMGQSDHNGYEYLAEMIEVLGITTNELEHLATVAKSAIEQNPEYYNEAKLIAPDSTAGLDFVPYIANYYAGAIIDTNKEKYYCAPTRDDNNIIETPSSYTEDKVTFRNLTLKISCEWTFVGCESVEFYNCVIKGAGYSLSFSECVKVLFNHCAFEGFSVYAIVKDNVDKLEFMNSLFSDCIHHYDRKSKDWEALGGVIHTKSPRFNDVIAVTIAGCIFMHCGGRNKANYYSSAIICNDTCEIQNSRFINCWNYHSGTEQDPATKFRALFNRYCQIGENDVISSANLRES